MVTSYVPFGHLWACVTVSMVVDSLLIKVFFEGKFFEGIIYAFWQRAGNLQKKVGTETFNKLLLIIQDYVYIGIVQI
jgi:hypothetical protein